MNWIKNNEDYTAKVGEYELIVYKNYTNSPFWHWSMVTATKISNYVAGESFFSTLEQAKAAAVAAYKNQINK